MFCNCVKGSLLFIILISKDLVYPFKAFLTCSILVLGNGTGFLVLGSGTGLSLNSNGG